METNPRVQVPGEWAPPPPVVVPPAQSTIQPVPLKAPDQAEEFEDLLGGLVEHYATLPPATFGEPPEPVLDSASDRTTTTTRRRSPVLWIALGIVGLTLAGLGIGGFLVYNKLKLDLDPSKIAAETTPPVQLAIKPTAPAPTIENVTAPTPKAPKVEQLTPIVEPSASEPPKAAPVAEKAPPRVTKLKKARVVKRRPRRSRRASRKVKKRRKAPAAAASSEDWDDPYK